MSDTTTRLGLPMIVPGQAQKEMSHNEALAIIDVALQPSVQAIGTVVPPGDPAPGECWVVGDAPTGDWAGRAGALAAWTDGGWRFVQPTPGFRLWSVTAGCDVRFIDGVWIEGTLSGDRLVLAGHDMLSSPAAAIDDPAGGTTIDGPARSAITAILDVLRHHNLVETLEM